MKKFLGLVFLAGLIFSCLEVWNWIWHRTPTEIVFKSNEVTELPKHVTLKSIFLSPNEVITNGDKVTLLYIPIRSTSHDISGKPLRFLLKTKDQTLLNAYKTTRSGDAAAQSLLTLKALLTKNEVSGMFDDHSLNSKERAQILKLLPVLTPDFRVLEEGRHPSLFIALFLLCMSAGALFIGSKLDGQSEGTVAPPPIGATIPPPLPK